MREQLSGEVSLPEMDEAIVKAMLSFMYGRLRQVPDQLLLPLFVAADAHQVSSCLLHLTFAKQAFMTYWNSSWFLLYIHCCTKIALHLCADVKKRSVPPCSYHGILLLRSHHTC